MNIRILRVVLLTVGLLLQIRPAYCEKPAKEGKKDWREEIRLRTSLPDSGSDYNWKVAAQKETLSVSAINAIEKSGMTITNKGFKQIFEPYLESELPLFITADAVIFGYHALLEESLIRLERKNAVKLPITLRVLLDTILVRSTGLSDKNNKATTRHSKRLDAAAKARATIFLATALRLTGEKFPSLDAELDSIVAQEVRRIMTANSVEKPDWLGKPDSGFSALDYSRFKPRGMYTESETMERYFRAISWMQAVPFRVEKEEELLSFIIMIKAYEDIRRHAYRTKLYFPPFPNYSELIGPPDAWDIKKHFWGNLDKFDMEELKKWQENYLDWAKPSSKPDITINDQLRFYPDARNTHAEVHFRVVSALQTPDALLFQKIMSMTQELPAVLSVPAALGASVSKDLLKPTCNQALLDTISAMAKFFENGGIYSFYLQTISQLLKPPEPEAPSIFSSKQWQLKSLQGFLSGYSLEKHALVLHAKESVLYGGMTMMPPGFVEPNPEFWGQMAQLCDRTLGYFDNVKAFDLDPKQTSIALKKAKRLLADKNFVRCLTDFREGDVTPEEARLATLVSDLLKSLWWSPKDTTKFVTSLAAEIDKLTAKLDDGTYLGDSRIAKYVEMEKQSIPVDWRKLSSICKHLEVLAHKQLRKRPLSKYDEKFIKSFGMSLGGILQYKGNSFLTPRDDSPRITDVAQDPVKGLYLSIGTCRPRALYLLYPYNGVPLLCRGAVLPFYEFHSTKRYSDPEWQQLLDSKDRPAVAEYLKELYSEELKKPVLSEH